MNGRIYDPTLARFLQADPHIQFPTATQGYNRYSYVLNNPMNYTDPSGYFLSGLKHIVKKYWRVVAAAVITYFTYGLASGWAAGWGLTSTTALGSIAATGAVISVPTLSVGGYMVAGAITGAVGGAVATGSLKGGINGAITGAVFGGLGYGQHVAGWGDGTQVFAHAMVGGIMSVAQGGKFGNGFVSAGIMKFAGKINTQGTVSRTVIQSLAGGTVSQITGGKFANGAQTSALQYMVNEVSVELTRKAAIAFSLQNAKNVYRANRALNNKESAFNLGTYVYQYEGEDGYRSDKWVNAEGALGNDVNSAPMSSYPSPNIDSIFRKNRQATDWIIVKDPMDSKGVYWSRAIDNNINSIYLWDVKKNTTYHYQYNEEKWSCSVFEGKGKC